MRQLNLSRGERAASHPSPSTANLPALQARRTIGRPRPPLFTAPLAGGTASLPPVAPIEGRDDDKDFSGGPSRLEQGTFPFPETRRRISGWLKVPLLGDCSSTPWSSVSLLVREAGDSPRALSEPIKILTYAPPREGQRARKEQDASTTGDPAHDDCPSCCSPAVGLPLRRPPLSRDEHCRRESARLYCDDEAPDPDEASARSSSV